MSSNNDTTTWTVDSYTAQYDDAMRPRLTPEAGDRVRIPEDPQGTGTTCDGREIDAFRRRCRDAGVEMGDYLHTEDGYDVFEIVASKG